MKTQHISEDNTTYQEYQKKVFVQVVSSLHPEPYNVNLKNLETIFWCCHNLDISVDFFFAYLGTTYLPAKLI